MQFVNKIEEETGIRKVILDLEGLVLPEKELCAYDTECRANVVSNFELVNKFLKTLSEDESKILVSGLISMRRVVYEHKDVEECTKELTNILTNMLQNPGLMLFDKLCSFSSDVNESHSGISNVWHPLFFRQLLASSLLSSMCIMTFNLFWECFVRSSGRIGYTRWSLIFVNSIKQSGKRGMAFVDYAREIISTALEGCDEDRKLDILCDLVSNPAACTNTCIEHGVACSIIEFVSQRMVASVVAKKWQENHIFASPEFGKLIIPDGVNLNRDVVQHIINSDDAAIGKTVQQLIDAGNDKTVVDEFISVTKEEIFMLNSIGQEFKSMMEAAKEKQDAKQ